ncbi:MAG: hypothetical protein HGB06_11555 [Chlorobaculum sp.]|jgi:hypothetical protein|nr:hypothetical protein [Chlorobaculum sp.]
MTEIKLFKKLLVFSGLFNIVLAAPLIIPGFFKSYIKGICSLNDAMGFGGVRPVLPEDGLSQLLINTAGIDLVLIGSILRFFAEFRGECFLGLRHRSIAMLSLPQ